MRSMASLRVSNSTTLVGSPAVARSALAFAARSPASSFSSRRALSSSCRPVQQFPRLQSLNSLAGKRGFATTGRMVWVNSIA